MSSSLEERVLAALDGVRDPCSIATRHPLGIVELGLLIGLDVAGDGRVRVLLRPTSPSCTLIASILQAAEQQVSAVPGVRSVSVAVDAASEWTPELMTVTGREKLQAARAQTLSTLGLRPRGGGGRRAGLAQG
jgi:metal-sulfur cluster biosynthetic enzyme